MSQLRSSGFTRAGLALLVIVVLACLVGPLLSPYEASFRGTPFSAPSPQHPLGTDDVGHDVLTAVLAGGAVSLLVGSVVGLVTATLGLVVGGLAGYVKGLDAPLMRVVDILLVIPRLPLIIFLSMFLKPNLWNVILVLSLFGWPVAARAVRPLAKSLRDREFVLAARSLGAGHWYIVRRHILPQLYPLFAVQFVLEARQAVMAEAGLGFLGLEDPSTQSWGMMLSYAFNHQATFLSQAWQWTVLPPALALTLFILGLSLVAVGLETAFNPRFAHTRRSAGAGQHAAPLIRKARERAVAAHAHLRTP